MGVSVSFAQSDFGRAMAAFEPFEARVEPEFKRTRAQLDVMQVNVGFKCNLACKHCHVEAGPARTEVMSREVMQACLDVARERGFKTLDVTGGAPEMNPNFEWFIGEARAAGLEVIVRSNLVILHEAPYAHLPEVYAKLGVVLFASLPHYVARQAEKQRGEGTFDAIVSMLQKLNELGYGAAEGGEDVTGDGQQNLQLNLVFNPSGAVMPPDQSALEAEYRARLKADFGVKFDRLFAIANNPNGRFGERLLKTGNLEGYMGRLIGAFNPAAVPAMMCRNQISVGWDGRVYDCDFNQAAQMPCLDGRSIFDYAEHPEVPLEREIAFGNHCYGCTAGAGSSCGGATA